MIEAGEDGLADQVVPDVEFGQLRDRGDGLDVLVGQPMPGVWFDAVLHRQRHAQAFLALAQGVLGPDSPFESAHPVMGALWRWHAAEENEHASVAFDVYREVGGNYPVRAVVMLAATLIFWAKVVEHALYVVAEAVVLLLMAAVILLARYLANRHGEDVETMVDEAARQIGDHPVAPVSVVPVSTSAAAAIHVAALMLTAMIFD